MLYRILIESTQVYREELCKQMWNLTLTHIHSKIHTNTTDLKPTSSPILPFLVLTIAGGCGVSNLMKQAGNNSWVCVETGLEGEGESRHKCPCQSRGARRESCSDCNNKPKMAASRSSGKRDSVSESLLSHLSGWLVWAHARPLRRAGMTPTSLGKGSQAELRVSEASSLLEQDLKAEPRAKTVWHQISLDSEPFTYFPIFSSLAPSLYLIGWGD